MLLVNLSSTCRGDVLMTLLPTTNSSPKVTTPLTKADLLVDNSTPSSQQVMDDMLSISTLLVVSVPW